MDPADAAAVLRKRLTDPLKPVTVADASVASGLALRDAEAGLHWLTTEYRGHLRVTEDGDLVHVFPHGFTKPWETKEALSRVLSSLRRAVVGAGRFLVRAWLLIVMIGYALFFVALILGAAIARQGSSDRDDTPGLYVLGALFRMIADALFWTFHPFSPFYIDPRSRRSPLEARRRDSAEAREKVAFYEKVNRFVFGPVVPEEDPNAARARVLREIRTQRGRISLADVMRITGLPRHEADPLMARLMLDHDGTVSVSEGGGLVYSFAALRRSAHEQPMGRQPNAWENPPRLPPLTGNDTTSNVMIALLNGFNLLMSAWVIDRNLTLDNIKLLLFEPDGPARMTYDGLPIAFGAIPLVFSLLIFVLPVARALYRTRTQKRVNQERARLSVLREVLRHSANRTPVSDEALREVVREATGDVPTSAEMTRRVVELGGDVDVGPEGEVRYRFAELEADAQAVEEERARASERETRLGRIVFASDQ